VNADAYDVKMAYIPINLTRGGIVYPFPVNFMDANMNKLPAGWTKIFEINRVAGQ
jgi:hypothetical protein